MEKRELALAPATFRLGVHAQQQVDVALRIEHDHDVAAMDVLGNQHLAQPGLAHARGAKHRHVPDAFANVEPDVALARFDAMQCRITTDGRQRRNRIPPCLATGHTRDPALGIPTLKIARTVVQVIAGEQLAVFGKTSLIQALRVNHVPAKAPPDKHFLR
ncbi:hypothetical protein OKW44_003606 [Paraburkholderia sp. WSM4174]